MCVCACVCRGGGVAIHYMALLSAILQRLTNVPVYTHTHTQAKFSHQWMIKKLWAWYGQLFFFLYLYLSNLFISLPQTLLLWQPISYDSIGEKKAKCCVAKWEQLVILTASSIKTLALAFFSVSFTVTSINIWTVAQCSTPFHPEHMFAGEDG